MSDSRIVIDNPLQTLRNYRGFYQCPKDGKGNFLGPLVAYAGTYVDSNGKTKNKVGDTYCNVAMVEPYPETREYYSRLIVCDAVEKGIRHPDKIVGMAMGGIKFAQSIGDIWGIPSIFAEKVVIKPADPDSGRKEESDIVISRHEILPGEQIFIGEDLCNSFSTTRKAIEVIEKLGGHVTGIVCVVNRSSSEEWDGVPVVTSLFMPLPQYKQEDKEVKDLVQSGKVIWKAKFFWKELEKLKNQ